VDTSSGTISSSDEKFTDYLARTQSRLERINKLMAEIKKLGEEQRKSLSEES
jgi:hypothetical protein